MYFVSRKIGKRNRKKMNLSLIYNIFCKLTSIAYRWDSLWLWSLFVGTALRSQRLRTDPVHEKNKLLKWKRWHPITVRRSTRPKGAFILLVFCILWVTADPFRVKQRQRRMACRLFCGWRRRVRTRSSSRK